jgi:hypothetical protein
MKDSQRNVVHSERNPPRVFDISLNSDVPDMFADSTGRIMMGAEICKIELTRNAGHIREGDLQVEQREVFARLAFPASTALELCTIILEQYAKNVGLLDQAVKLNRENLKANIKRIGALEI